MQEYEEHKEQSRAQFVLLFQPESVSPKKTKMIPLIHRV